MQKISSKQLTRRLIFVFLFFFLPALCWALDMDELKVDFLHGNYRRVIFEGQAEVDRIHLGNTGELNYVLGLSYLKEFKLDQAQNCFRRILNNSNSKFKQEASLALADTYLVSGQFPQAEDAYNKLITDTANSDQKPAVLFRLSQLETKRGNHQKANEYLVKLRKDFPLSSELKALPIDFANTYAPACQPSTNVAAEFGEYSVQVGFFTSSDNANNFKNALLGKGYPAYVENSGAGYRVKVGKFKTQKEALDTEARLSREGFQTKVCPL
jgi:tetratricopeptide (TPR) repeat protein